MPDDEHGRPPEQPSEPVEEGSEVGEEDEEPVEFPESPYTTEELEFMVPDEILAVRLRGGTIGARSIPMSIAAPFMFRLHEFVHAVTLRVSGREPGKRGPLPPVEEAGLLAFAAFAGDASVTLHFQIGPGEAFRIDPAATESITSLTERALEVVTGYLEATAIGDRATLIGMSQELGQRVGSDFVLLVRHLAQQHVESIWRPRIVDQPIHVSVVHAREAELALEEPGETAVEERDIRGWLYETNAKKREFLLEPVDVGIERLSGIYGPEMREALRGAWDREVVLRVLVTEERLLRQPEPTNITIELLEVLDVIE